MKTGSTLAQVILSNSCRGRRPRRPEKRRTIANKICVCHPERSRTFAERRARQKRKAQAAAGSRNKFRWLTDAMLHLLKKQHPDR